MAESEAELVAWCANCGGPVSFSEVKPDDEPELPAGVRLSVQAREDFVVVDEEAFHSDVVRILTAHGAWPQEQPEPGPMGDLMALVDTVGVQKLTGGWEVGGLRNTGGETFVGVVYDGEPEG